MQLRHIQQSELQRTLFSEFVRRQKVDLCRRKVDGVWRTVSDPFIDDWTEEEYAELLRCLTHTLETGGLVVGAFCRETLKGFASVEREYFGGDNGYLDLSSIHVSEDCRGQGIGKALFLFAADWARQHGAKKLYISAHSAVESQAFYAAMGCVEAAEYNAAHVEAEPCDCQLECVL